MPKPLTMYQRRNPDHIPRLRAGATSMLALAAISLATGVTRAEDEHLGQIEYEIACMTCHGVDGKGDGPLARQLSQLPSDLTQISTRHDGTFPTDKMARIIDGAPSSKVTACGKCPYGEHATELQWKTAKTKPRLTKEHANALRLS